MQLYRELVLLRLRINMKTINVTFDDEEYVLLLKRKQDASWHDFIMEKTQ